MADVLQPQAVVQLTTSLQTIYTVPAATKAVVTFARISNATINPTTVRVHVIPNGGTASIANSIMYDFSLPANDFIDFGKGLLLPAQAFVQAVASANNALTLKLDLIESS